MNHQQPPDARTCAVYTLQSVKREGDLTSREVQRQMCVGFVRTAGRPAYRLLEQFRESRVELRIAAINEAALVRYSEQLLDFPHEVVMSVCRPDHGNRQ